MFDVIDDHYLFPVGMRLSWNLVNVCMKLLHVY